jgi:chemotaxis response regulator CheB
LEEQPRFSVCGEAYEGVKALEEAQRLKPDVVVLKKFGTEKSTIKSRPWLRLWRYALA